MASEENRERNEEFERRVVAIIRDQFETMAEDFPHGYEFADFVITCRFYAAPAPDDSMEPWYGGPYPGWVQNGWTRGSSTSWPVDIALIAEASEHLQRRFDEHQSSGEDDHDNGTSEPDDD